MASSFQCLDIGALILAFWLLLKYSIKRKTLPRPPGPSGLPVIGNLLDIITDHPWNKFSEWGRRWGTVFSRFIGAVEC